LAKRVENSVPARYFQLSSKTAAALRRLAPGDVLFATCYAAGRSR
jgi:hypothetical protein